MQIPETFTINITTRCNLRCEFCFNSDEYYESSSHLPLDDCLKNVQYLIDNNVKNVDLTPTVGEALMHPDIVEIIKFILDNDLTCTLITNLTIKMDDELIQLFKHPNFKLFISQYGSDNETYNNVTKSQMYNSFKNNFTKLFKEKVYMNIIDRFNGKIDPYFKTLFQSNNINFIQTEIHNRSLVETEIVLNPEKCRFLKEPIINSNLISKCCYDYKSEEPIGSTSDSLKNIYSNLKIECGKCPWYQL